MTSESFDQDFQANEHTHKLPATTTPAVPLKCFLLYVSGIVLFFMATIGSYQFADDTTRSHTHRQLLDITQASQAESTAHEHHVDTSNLYKHAQHALDVDYAHETEILIRINNIQAELDSLKKKHIHLAEISKKLHAEKEKLQKVQADETIAGVGEDKAGVAQSDDHGSINQELHVTLSGLTARIFEIEKTILAGQVQITAHEKQLESLQQKEEAVKKQEEADKAALDAAKLENKVHKIYQCSFEELTSAKCAFPETLDLSDDKQQHMLTVLNPPPYIKLHFTKLQAYDCDVLFSLGVNHICETASKQGLSNARTICRVDMEVDDSQQLDQAEQHLPTHKHRHRHHHCTQCNSGVFDLALLDHSETPNGEEAPESDEHISKVCLIFRKRTEQPKCQVVTDISIEHADKKTAAEHIACSDNLHHKRRKSKKDKAKKTVSQQVEAESESDKEEKANEEEANDSSAAVWHNQSALYWSVIASFIAVVTGTISLFFIMQ